MEAFVWEAAGLVANSWSTISKFNHSVFPQACHKHMRNGGMWQVSSRHLPQQVFKPRRFSSLRRAVSVCNWQVLGGDVRANSNFQHGPFQTAYSMRAVSTRTISLLLTQWGLFQTAYLEHWGIYLEHWGIWHLEHSIRCPTQFGTRETYVPRTSANSPGHLTSPHWCLVHRVLRLGLACRCRASRRGLALSFEVQLTLHG